MKLEDAIYHTAHDLGIDELASKLGTSRNTVQHKANPHDPAHYFKPRELVAMQDFARDYRITHAIAEELGGQFVAPANFAHLGDQALVDLFAGLMERMGAFAGDFRAAWADGRLDLKEFAGIRDDLYKVKQVCAELEARMATLVETRPKIHSIERVRPGAK